MHIFAYGQQALPDGDAIAVGPGDAPFGQYSADALRFARECLHWDPDERQCEILQAAGHLRMILNWARQSGKSTLCAVLILHWAVTHPGKTIVILGGVESDIVELMERIDQFLGELGWPVRGVRGKSLSRRLPNRTRILGATTKKNTRGPTASMVVMDEASLIQDVVWESMMPTLAMTNGPLLVAGTPNGTSGGFYDVWNSTDGDGTWLRSSYPATENPRIAKSFLDEMRRMKGETFVRQEFLCEFVANGRNLLARDVVQRVFDLG
jgi:hypothetical protein